MRHTSHVGRVRAALAAKGATGLDRAVSHLVEEIRGEISIQGPPRSEPGHPPHVDTGRLLASWGHVTSAPALRARAYSDVPWSVYLELGTRDMLPRPSILPTLLRTGPALARLIVLGSS
jgi:hypothetical protein